MHKLLIAAVVASVALPDAAFAQSEIGPRVTRLESEMRAVQRKVFPNGAGQYLEPEVSPAPYGGPPPGSPSASAVSDLTARVGSLESQMATLTGQVEQNQYRLRLLQDQFDTYRRQTDAKLVGIGTAGGPVGDAPPPRTEPRADSRTAPRPGTSPRYGGSGVPAPRYADDSARDPRADAPPLSTASPTVTGGDPAEDAYLAGYRLWAAKRYPEAEVQLKRVVADYPNTRRASYAQNLLGRSYLDEGKPSLASMAFYDNYKKMPEGERAPDSLYFLAQALMRLNKPTDACKVYGELSDVYGGKITNEMRANVTRGRVTAHCQ